MEGNKKHKDRVFRKLFGYEKYKGNLLELYNALNDSNYTNPDEHEKWRVMHYRLEHGYLWASKYMEL